MRVIVCEDCGKRYNYEKDEFCPRCGAFNQPVKTWGVDAKGNVIRVDGVNEQNHAGSFVHKEVHHEKDVRRAKGLDWKTAGRRPASPQAGKRPVAAPEQKRNPVPLIAAIVGIIIIINMLISLLAVLF